MRRAEPIPAAGAAQAGGQPSGAEGEERPGICLSRRLEGLRGQVSPLRGTGRHSHHRYRRGRPGLGPPSARASLNVAWSNLYRGDLLPEATGEPWTLVERERLRLAYIGALERLAATQQELGEPEEAVEHLRTILRLDPWREEVYRQLMRLLAGLGRRSEALRLYRECEAVLRSELEVAPSPETVSVYRQIAGR